MAVKSTKKPTPAIVKHDDHEDRLLRGCASSRREPVEIAHKRMQHVGRIAVIEERPAYGEDP
jgi:hypothetical protein